MKTILMICPFAKPNVGGVESHLEKLIGLLGKRHYKVILISYQPLTTKAKGAAYERTDNIERFRQSWFGRGWFPKLEANFVLVFIYLFPGLFLKSLFLYLRRHQEIDVIHAHGFIAAAIAKILAKIIKKRTVLSTHAIYRLSQRKLLSSLVKWMLKDFAAILAVGEPSKQELIKIGLDGQKIKVHPNWTNIDVFKPLDRAECRTAFKLNKSDFVVLFLGRLIELKGVLILLDVAKKTTRDITFVFAGDGPLSETIENAAQTNPKVKFYGRLSESNMPLAYNAADVFVSPVLYDEGFGAVYLESIACGTFVLTAKRGCLPYFLDLEVADLLEDISEETILEKLEYYFDHPDILRGKRDVCRSYAEQHFSEKNAEVILNSY